MKLTIGTAKITCAFGKCAMTTQQTGIVIAPTMKAREAKTLNQRPRQQKNFWRGQAKEQVHRAKAEEGDVPGRSSGV